jgi:type II secretory pathway predicted ATPase ExeA
MYADFFGLRELPFNNTPDPRFFYSTPDHEEALASLIYAVKQRKGFVLVTGEVGAGKTLVSRLMLRQFGSSITFANINHAVRSAGDLLESLCTEFELQIPTGASHTQMVRALHDFLLVKFAENVPVVLVLDEAQNLPIQAFEQLRMIGNLEADDAKLLQIAILGQPELQQVFQSHELRQLKQRLFSNYHLPALDREATDGYIRYRLSVAGARHTNLFNTSAVDKLFDASRGVPRLINTLCDNAMLAAYSAGRRTIEEDLVDTMLAQLAASDKQATEQTRAPGTPVQHAPPSMWASPYQPQPYAPHMYPNMPMQQPWQTPMQPVYGATQPMYAPAAAMAPPAPSIYARPPVAPSAAKIDRPSIRERLEQAKQRATKLELRYSGGAASAREARNTRANLKSATHHAETILGKIETASLGLSQREKSLGSLSTSVRQVANELTNLLNDVRTTSAETKRDRQRAENLHARLHNLTQAPDAPIEQQPNNNTIKVAPKKSHKRDPNGGARLLKAATALIAENKLAAIAPDPRNLERILSDTRKTTHDLRTLAKNVQATISASAERLAHKAEKLAAATLPAGA